MVVAVALFVLAVLGVGAAVGVAARGLGPSPRVLVRGSAVVGLLLAAAGVVFTLVAEDAVLGTVDLPVLDGMIAHRTAGLTRVADLVSLVGGTGFTGGLAVVTAVVLFLRGRRRWALIWTLGVAAGATTIRLVKIVVERPRPPEVQRLAEETTASMPSGHALMSALGLGLTAAAVVALARGTVRVLAAVLTVVAAATIGTSRVYLGVHWTTDVVAGWLLGAAGAAACLTLALLLDARAAQRPSGRPPPVEAVAGSADGSSAWDPPGPADR